MHTFRLGDRTYRCNTLTPRAMAAAVTAQSQGGNTEEVAKRLQQAFQVDNLDAPIPPSDLSRTQGLELTLPQAPRASSTPASPKPPTPMGTVAQDAVALNAGRVGIVHPVPVAPNSARAKSAHAYLQRHHIPGIALFIEDGQVTLHQAYGEAQKNEALQVDQSVPIGSVTKPLTAWAVVELSKAGKLELDQPLKDQIPNLLPSTPGWGTLTPRQLIEHTSGLPDSSSLWKDGIKVGDYLKRLSDIIPGPAGPYCYSNLGYLLLGQLLQHASDKPAETCIKEMLEQHFGAQGISTADDHASFPAAYGPDGPLLEPEGDMHAALRIAGSSGGLCASIADLGTIVLTTLQDPPHLQAAPVQSSDGSYHGGFQPRQGWNQTARLLDGTGEAIQEIWKHGAIGASEDATTGFGTMAIMYPDRNAGFVFWTPAGGASEPVASVLSHLLLAAEPGELGGPGGVYQAPAAWGNPAAVISIVGNAKEGYKLQFTEPEHSLVTLQADSSRDNTWTFQGPLNDTVTLELRDAGIAWNGELLQRL